MEKVGTAFRPLLVQPSGPFTTRVIALGDFLREVVAILFEAVSGVQLGFLRTVCHSGEVTDAEVNTRCFVTGCVRSLDFVFADEVEFPSLRRLVVDGSNLLQVLDGDAGGRLVLNEDVVPVSRVVFVVCAFREPDSVVLRVVFDAVLLPRHRAARVFFVDATALVVVVVFLR